MAATEKQLIAAAQDFFSIIVGKLKNEKGVHAETAMAAAGRMAGTFMLRSFQLPLENLQPGTVLLSEEANEKGPDLISLLAHSLARFQLPIVPNKVGSIQGKRDQPQLGVTETQQLLQKDLFQAVKKHQLSFDEATQAITVAAALIIRECASIIDPQSGYEIAAYGLVEGSKTVPLPLAENNVAKLRKPWYRFW